MLCNLRMTYGEFKRNQFGSSDYKKCGPLKPLNGVHRMILIFIKFGNEGYVKINDLHGHRKEGIKYDFLE